MQLKMNDHRAHLSGLRGPAWLFDQGDEGAETSVRPDLTQGEPKEGESLGKKRTQECCLGRCIPLQTLR